MLNTKYIIRRGLNGEKIISENKDVLGSAWFVEGLRGGLSIEKQLTSIPVLNHNLMAVSNYYEGNKKYLKDDFSSIDLIEKTSNYIKYKTFNNNDGFAVFSEIYYPHGWVSTINGEETPHYRVNFLLRGMEIPKGEHVIEFRFDPDIVKTSSKISLAGTSIFVLLTIFLGYLKFRKVQKF